MSCYATLGSHGIAFDKTLGEAACVPLGGLICSERERKKVVFGTEVVWVMKPWIQDLSCPAHLGLSVLRHCGAFYEGSSSWDGGFSSLCVPKSQLGNAWRPCRDLLEAVPDLRYRLSHTTYPALLRTEVSCLGVGLSPRPLREAPCLHASVMFSMGVLFWWTPPFLRESGCISLDVLFRTPVVCMVS